MELDQPLTSWCPFLYRQHSHRHGRCSSAVDGQSGEAVRPRYLGSSETHVLQTEGPGDQAPVSSPHLASGGYLRCVGFGQSFFGCHNRFSCKLSFVSLFY